MDFLEGQSNNLTNEKVRRATALPKLKTLSDAEVWDGFDIFYEWIAIDFRDKLSHGNPRVSGDQVDRDRTGKMSSRQISGTWASAGTRLKRLRRTGGAGGIVSPNASLTRDEPATRNNCAGSANLAECALMSAILLKLYNKCK